MNCCTTSLICLGFSVFYVMAYNKELATGTWLISGSTDDEQTRMEVAFFFAVLCLLWVNYRISQQSSGPILTSLWLQIFFFPPRSLFFPTLTFPAFVTLKTRSLNSCVCYYVLASLLIPWSTATAVARLWNPTQSGRTLPSVHIQAMPTRVHSLSSWLLSMTAVMAKGWGTTAVMANGHYIWRRCVHLPLWPQACSQASVQKSRLLLCSPIISFFFHKQIKTRQSSDVQQQ